MDILTINEIKKTIKESKKNRFNEPCFGVVSLYSNSQWGTQVYDHNLNKIGAVKRWRESYRSYETENATELANSQYSYATTNSTTSSSSNRGNGTSMSGHLGHNCIQVAKNGSFSFTYNNKASQRDIGTWVNSKTPNYTINLDGNKGFIGLRTYNISDKDTIFGNAKTITGLNTNSKFGMISYNEKSKKLAIIESNGSYQIRLNVWSNVKAPTNFKTNEEFFGESNLTTGFV